MAKKKQGPKILLERSYNIPLRREFIKVPKYKKTKKAVKALKEFLVKHMKIDEVKIGPKLNEKLWENGMRNPPHHVKVSAIKEDVDGVHIVKAELEGVKFKALQIKEKTEKAGGLKGKIKSMVGKEEKPEGSLEELAGWEKKEVKKSEVKVAPKLETKKEEVKPKTTN